MTVSWEQFKNNTVKALNNGEITFSKKVSEFDLAVQYATCILWEQGVSTFTSEQIAEVLDRNVPNVGNLSIKKIYG